MTEIAGAAELVDDVDRFAPPASRSGWVIVDNPWEAALCVGSLDVRPAARSPIRTGTIARLHGRGRPRDDVGLAHRPPALRLGTLPCRAGHRDGRPTGDRPHRPGVLATFEQRLAQPARDRGRRVQGRSRRRGRPRAARARGAAAATTSTTQYPLLVRAGGRRRVGCRRAAAACRRSVPRRLHGLAARSSPGRGRATCREPGTASRTPSAAPRPPASSATPPGAPTSAATWLAILTRRRLRALGQLGAISPVFEVGGDGPNSTPWELGAAAMAGLRSVGHPALRALSLPLRARPPCAARPGSRSCARWPFGTPSDERSWRAEYELLVGPDLLAAPRDPTRARRRPCTSRRTPGSISGRDRVLGAGPRLATPDAARRAAAVPSRGGGDPVQPPRIPTSGGRPGGSNDLFRAGRGGWLVAPGPTAGNGHVGRLRRRLTDHGDAVSAIRLQLTRARRETQVVVLGRRVPTGDDRRALVARSTSARRFARSGRAGSSTRRPFPGVVLKLAPRAGRSSSRLDYAGRRRVGR